MHDSVKRLTSGGVRLLATCAGSRLSRILLRYLVVPRLLPAADMRGITARVKRHFDFYLSGGVKETHALIRLFRRAYQEKIVDDLLLMNRPPGIYKKSLERSLRIRKGGHLTEALTGKKGILLLGSHIGSVLPATLGVINTSLTMGNSRNLTVCTEPQLCRFPAFGAWLDLYRREYGERVDWLVVGAGYGNPALKIIRTLKQGDIVAANLDVVNGGQDRTVYAIMDNLKLYLPALSGAVQCAWRSGATILPWFNYRDRHGHLVLTFEKPLFPGDDQHSPHELAASLATTFGIHLNARPEQWLYWDRLERRLAG